MALSKLSSLQIGCALLQSSFSHQRKVTRDTSAQQRQPPESRDLPMECESEVCQMESKQEVSLQLVTGNAMDEFELIRDSSFRVASLLPLP